MDVRRLRGVCGKVIRRLLSLRVAAAFERWHEYLRMGRLTASRLFQADLLLRRRYLTVVRLSFLEWHSHIKVIERLRTIGHIAFARCNHNLLLRVTWSWRWCVSYRQMGFEKMVMKRNQLQLLQAFKTMRAALKPKRSWLIERFQNHILLSNAFDAWSAASALSSSICSLVHRHYTFPFMAAWKQTTLMKRTIRRMFMRRSFLRWRALVYRRQWIRISSYALGCHSSSRFMKTYFDAWRDFKIRSRFEQKFHLRFIYSSWKRFSRLTACARLFINLLESKKKLKAFALWRSVVNAERLAPVIKIHAYAAAASRRATFSPSSPVQSLGVSPPVSSRTSQRSWRS
jgi:hypothetical protein